jgi:CheY-like chemotaxis protein
MRLEESDVRAQLRHDLKARLAVIVGYAELLRTRDDAEIRREGPARIAEAADLLGQQIDELFGESILPGERDGVSDNGGEDRSSSGTVLIVDDDEFIRWLLKSTLPAADFTVREAADGREGLRLVEEEQPSLVLVDWLMPIIAGAELLAELKRRWPNLPVVVLTAETRQGERERAESLGADGFLTKPFSPLELLETVERLVAQRATDKSA